MRKAPLEVDGMMIASVISGTRTPMVAPALHVKLENTLQHTATVLILKGISACVGCSAGQYSTDVGATTNTCKGCPSNSFSPEASDAQNDFICNAGSTGPDGGSCVNCIAGTFKIDGGNAACTTCVENQYSTVVGAASNVCVGCQTDSNSPAGSDERGDCKCLPGGPREETMYRVQIA